MEEGDSHILIILHYLYEYVNTLKKQFKNTQILMSNLAMKTLDLIILRKSVKLELY